ncbi:MAG: hypothetical protein U0U66_05355 [Cytophagaceae bacterium]
MQAKYSYYSVIFCILALLSSLSITRRWGNDVVQWDIKHYYLYLPATIIEHDPSLHFLNSDATIYQDKTWKYTNEEGEYVYKMSGGLAFLYLPFFCLAHGAALMYPETSAPTGYSLFYFLALQCSLLFYVSIGLIYLRKFLLCFFNEITTAITILLLFFGTNLFYYSFVEVMPHAYSFSLVAILCYYTIQYYQQATLQRIIVIALTIGLIVWIRPVDIIITAIFPLWGVYSLDSLKKRIQFFIQQKTHLLLLVLIPFLLWCIQSYYWHQTTGEWMYWSYVDEHFFFNHPHVWEGLFGFRKGWFIYTPLMLVACLGFVLLAKYLKESRAIIYVLFPVFLYVTFSWWCWWYGGSVSCRPLIDFYAVMALGLGFMVQTTIHSKKFMGGVLLILLAFYGLFYNIQYEREILHWDSMTYPSWKAGFGKLHMTDEYARSFQKPDEEHQKKFGWERK